MKPYITLLTLLSSFVVTAQINLISHTPLDAASDDGFGISTCVNGEYMIVGSYRHDLNASGTSPISNAGSAYIYENSGRTWTQVAKLDPQTNNGNSDRDQQDEFGYSVSISGNVACSIGISCTV